MAVHDTSLVLFGSLSRFTFFALKNLLEQGFVLRAVVLAAYPPSRDQRGGSLAVIHRSKQPELLDLAKNHSIPVGYFGDDANELCAFVRDLSADVYLLACYPRKLPRAIVETAKYCSINIHPSKLPKYKGPDPIFWQLLSAEIQTGVSLHEVSDRIDSGDIFHFEPVTYPPGATLEQIQSALLKRAILSLAKLLDTRPNRWHREPQDHQKSSYQPMPCAEDYSITSTVSMQTAINFVRAYSRTNKTVRVSVADRQYNVQDATRWQKAGSIDKQNVQSGRIAVQFNDGIVEFSIDRQSNIQ